MDRITQAIIAKAIIFVFLLITAVLVLAAAFGFSDWKDIKEILTAWSATYSILVGAVVGYYFGANTTQPT